MDGKDTDETPTEAYETEIKDTEVKDTEVKDTEVNVSTETAEATTESITYKADYPSNDTKMEANTSYKLSQETVYQPAQQATLPADNPTESVPVVLLPPTTSIGRSRMMRSSFLHGSSADPEANRERYRDFDSLLNQRRVNSYNRSLALSQLENFYLPFMKDVYGRASYKLAGNIKPPEELIQQLRQAYPSGRMIGSEAMRRELEAKDVRINELLSKVQQLYEQLKQLKPEEEIKVEMPRQLEDYEKKIKRLENLLRIRNEYSFFGLRVKATNLLEEFYVDKLEIDGVQQITNEGYLFEFMSDKLKSKLKDLKSRQKSTRYEHLKEKQELSHFEYNVRLLTETNELLKNNERRAREKADYIKKEWKAACYRLVQCQKANEQKDSEIFRMKKLLDEREAQLVKLPSLEKNHQQQLEQLRRYHEQQLRDMRQLMNNNHLELEQLKITLDSRNDYIYEYMIRQNFLQEEFERANREHMRWKYRYESFYKEAENKRFTLEKEHAYLLEKVNKLAGYPYKVAELQEVNNKISEELRKVTDEKIILEERTKQLYADLRQIEHYAEDVYIHNNYLQSALAIIHKDKMEATEKLRLLYHYKIKMENHNKDLNSTIAQLQREKSYKVRSLEDIVQKLDQHNKDLQSALALKYKEKSELADKVTNLEQQLSSKKSQTADIAAMESKFKSQLAHEQTLRYALILQAVSAKYLEYMDKMKQMQEANNKKILTMEQTFDKKMKSWQSSHDDKFLEELARLGEYNTVLKEKLAAKDKYYLRNSLITSTVVTTPMSSGSISSTNSLPSKDAPTLSKRVEVIRAKDFKK